MKIVNLREDPEIGTVLGLWFLRDSFDFKIIAGLEHFIRQPGSEHEGPLRGRDRCPLS